MSRVSLQDINHMLRVVSTRYEDRHNGAKPPGAQNLDCVDARNPFTELAEKEEAMNADIDAEESARIWLEAVAFLLDFVTHEGPHPGYVMLNLYVLLKKYRPEAIWEMGYRQIGLLFGVSGAAIEWRVSQLDDFARALGLNGVKAVWQRSQSGCESYSHVQKGNCNRLGGNKANKNKKK